MEPEQHLEAILQQDIDKYNRTNLKKSDYQRKMILEDKQSGMKYIAYAYLLEKGLKPIQRQLKKEIKKYRMIEEDSLADLEDVFTTSIHKKSFIVFCRKYRQSQTFADIAGNKDLKSTLDLMSVVTKIVDSLLKLEEKEIRHNNLSVETVEYCRKNVIIDVPLFSAVRQSMKELANEEQNQQQVKMKNEVKNFIQIVIKISVGKKFSKKSLDLYSEATLAYLEQIKEEKIKNLLKHILIDKKGSSEQINFKYIRYFLEEGKPLVQIGKKKEKEKVEEQTETDILGLPIFGQFSQERDVFPTKKDFQKVVFESKHENEHFQIKIKSFLQFIVFNIQSKQNSLLSSTTILRSESEHYPFRKYFRQIKDFTNFLGEKKVGKFFVEQSGILQYLVPYEYAKSLQSALRLETNRSLTKLNKFPENCIGYIYEGSFFAGRCFLLNSNILITSASCLYDRKRKRRRKDLIFSLPVCRSNCAQVIYPPEYQTCSEEEVWKYNYGVVLITQISVNSQMYTSIVYNYDEVQARNNLKKDNYSDVKYFINSNYLENHELTFQDGIILGINTQFEQGCPVFARVGKKLIVIGMKTSKNTGIIFNELHFWSILKFMHLLKIEKQKILRSRIYDFKYLNHQEEEVKDYDFSFEKAFKTNPNINLKDLVNQYLSEGNISKAITLLQWSISKPYIHSNHKIKYIEVILTLYPQRYPPKHWKISHTLCQLGNAHKTQNNLKESERNLLEALEFERNHGRNNPVLIAEASFYLGYISQILEKQGQAEEYYKAALALYEKMDSLQELARCYHNLGHHYKYNDKMDLSCQCYQKALELKQKYCSQSDYVSTLISYSENAIEKGRFDEGAATLEKLVVIAKRANQKQMLVKQKAEQIWKLLEEKALICQTTKKANESMRKIQKFYKIGDEE